LSVVGGVDELEHAMIANATASRVCSNMVTAYPWIVTSALAIAGCNSIFGLDDKAAFLPPDGPPLDAEPFFGTCIDDRFDSLDESTWTRFVTPGITVDAVGGELAIEGTATTGGLAGVKSRAYGFFGGFVEVTLTDSIASQTELATLVLQLDDGARVTMRRDSARTNVSIMDGIGTGTIVDETNRLHWRITHNTTDSTLVFDFSVDGMVYDQVGLRAISDTAVSSVELTLRGEYGTNGSDRIAFDNVKLQGLCPP